MSREIAAAGPERSMLSHLGKLPRLNLLEGCTPIERLANQELQFSELVAAATDAHQVVALDVDRRAVTAERLFKPRQALDRSVPLQQGASRSFLKLI